MIFPLRFVLIVLLGSAVHGPLLSAEAAAKSGKRGSKAKRRGDEGRSGQRCTICQKIALEAGRVWALAKTAKPGSPYHYIGLGSQGQAAEEKVIEVMNQKVCNRNLLAQLPNPRGYALHHPTLKYECDDVLENFGEALVDALTLGEDMAAFCFSTLSLRMTMMTWRTAPLSRA
eukprot:TRINITY_DN21822_c0_g1_i3.p1 TRINITY_DN21822_c0_g1~~TRINITY_DN21822_c0_g1_i3.p1  ORF type:complete len:173 (+),score=40.45 TRINITY_DN21822_c0_g1_i3:41-559(+)